MIPGFIVYGDLNLVRLVNRELMQLVCPFVVSCRLGAPLDRVLHFDVNECFWTATKAAGGCVVDVGDFVYAQGEVTAQWLSLTGNVQAVVYYESVCAQEIY